MEPLLTAAEMREADRYAVEAIGIPELVLMEHAALALADSITRRFGRLLPQTRGLVLAGPGNNGGDVVAAARLLTHRGCSNVLVILIGDETRLSASCAQQLVALGRLGIARASELTAELVRASDWVLDGLFGTGLAREVEGPARHAIELLNAAEHRPWIVSADVPSGLCADTGYAMGVAVKACETVALGFLKRGLVTGAAAEYVGTLRLSTIEIPRLVPGVHPKAFLYEAEDARRALPLRAAASHKGNFGHVVVFAGPAAKEGAAALCAWAALRTGAGLISVAVEGDSGALRARLRPEVMLTTVEQALAAPQGKVAVIGPGLGTEAGAVTLLGRVLEAPWPLVLDADALNLVAEGPAKLAARVRARGTESPTLLTPHPKEAARLLHTTVDKIQADRYGTVELLASSYGAWALLKGKGTLIHGEGAPTVVVDRGTPALAKGGSGDVLSGILAGLLAHGVSPQRAAALGAFAHGRAAEIESHERGERGAAAGEIADRLPQVFRELEDGAGIPGVTRR